MINVITTNGTVSFPGKKVMPQSSVIRSLAKLPKPYGAMLVDVRHLNCSRSTVQLLFDLLFLLTDNERATGEEVKEKQAQIDQICQDNQKEIGNALHLAFVWKIHVVVNVLVERFCDLAILCIQSSANIPALHEPMYKAILDALDRFELVKRRDLVQRVLQSIPNENRKAWLIGFWNTANADNQRILQLAKLPKAVRHVLSIPIS